MKRVKERRKCANPLFEKWLLEWKNEAKLKNSNVEYNFAKAINSLRKYPLRLESGRDCILLQHFGTKLCAMLDKKLKNYNENEREFSTSQPLELPEVYDDSENDVLPKKSRSLDGNAISSKTESRRKSAEKMKRSTTPIAGKIRKVHSISSSDSDDPDSPLMEVPKIVTEHLKKTSTAVGRLKKNLQDEEITGKKKSETNICDIEIPVGDTFRLRANNFDIVLLVDIHETGSGKTKSKEDVTKLELDRLATPYEVRHLKIGDFAWIARCRDTKKELILPYIVERKRMDDLASSIKDGRFHEQKFRLKQSGIQNLIYMVESYGNNQHTGIPLPTLLQASTNCLVQDDFTVKFTSSHRDSMRYLSILTTLIYKIYKEKSLVSSAKEDLETEYILRSEVPLMEFVRFNKAASKVKVFKVKEMFIRQLLQLKGLSLEKVLAIVERYPTPVLLTKAFEIAGGEAENLLATIKVGSLKRQLGPTLSRTIYEFYTKKRLE